MPDPVTPPAPVVTPPAAPPAASPWAADAAEFFGDNAEAIASFDRYMREKQQPYITQLEQGSKPARELYQDLIDNPQQTLAEVVTELYGDEFGTKFSALYDAAPAGTTPAAVVEATKAALDPDDAVAVAWAKAKRQEEADTKLREEGQAAYQELLVGMRAAHTDLTDEDMELIHPFMSAASGDTEAAYTGYQAFKQSENEQLKAALLAAGWKAPEGAAPPPAVLGSEGTSTTVPVEKKYASYDEAIDDWFAERRAAEPPPVI